MLAAWALGLRGGGAAAARATSRHDPRPSARAAADPRRARRRRRRRAVVVARRGRGAPAGRLPAGRRARASRTRSAARAARAAAPTWPRSTCAAKLEDGRQVLVPLRGATRAAVGGGRGRLRPRRPAPVDLNTATLEQLDQLDGVGPGTAAEDPRLPRPSTAASGRSTSSTRSRDRREAPRRAARAGAGVTGAPARWRSAAVARTRGTSSSSRSSPGWASGRLLARSAHARRAPLPRRRWSSARPGGCGLLAAAARSSAGAALADARLAALDAGVLGARCTAGVWEGERGRARAGPRARRARLGARVRLLEGPERRAGRPRAAPGAWRDRASRAAGPRWGRSSSLVRAGRAAGPFDAYQRRRGAHAALEVGPAAARPARGGAGSPGARRRPAAGRARARPRAAPRRRRRCCAGWCSAQDERLSDEVRDGLPALRASRTSSR